MATLAFYEQHVERLFEILGILNEALSGARIPYRVIGGLAIYLRVNRVDPLNARLTRDVDISVRREDIPAIAEAIRPFGFVYRHVAGTDMLVDAKNPSARTAVHLIFVGEKVRKEYVDAVPDFVSPPEMIDGAPVPPVEDLLRMKLTSFRDKDRVHVRDLDSAGLITPEVEASLAPVLRERLAEVRATE
jgi:hypothetical protein